RLWFSWLVRGAQLGWSRLRAGRMSGARHADLHASVEDYVVDHFLVRRMLHWTGTLEIQDVICCLHGGRAAAVHHFSKKPEANHEDCRSGGRAAYLLLVHSARGYGASGFHLHRR